MKIMLEHNSRVLSLLGGLACAGRLPHALLLEAPEGGGKKTCAAYFASLALCREPADGTPCGVCPHCVKVEKGIHPDVRYFTLPEGKKEFPVDLVRAVRQEAFVAPNEGDCKIYILDNAHTMNTAAQNALLKILEEPPAHVRFVLLCENRSKMLTTILSRVMSLELEIPDPEKCALTLERLAPQAGEIQRRGAAAGAGGNIGRALSLLEEAKPSKTAADIRRLQEALIFGTRYEALVILSGYEKDKQALSLLLSLLEDAFAKLACARYRPQQAEEETTARLINRVTASQALGAAAAARQAARRLEANTGPGLLCACLVEQAKLALEQ